MMFEGLEEQETIGSYGSDAFRCRSRVSMASTTASSGRRKDVLRIASTVLGRSMRFLAAACSRIAKVGIVKMFPISDLLRSLWALQFFTYFFRNDDLTDKPSKMSMSPISMR
jgi:hypothetical protein